MIGVNFRVLTSICGLRGLLFGPQGDLRFIRIEVPVLPLESSLFLGRCSWQLLVNGVLTL